jgi:hypothetical protein
MQLRVFIIVKNTETSLTNCLFILLLMTIIKIRDLCLLERRRKQEIKEKIHCRSYTKE